MTYVISENEVETVLVTETVDGVVLALDERYIHRTVPMPQIREAFGCTAQYLGYTLTVSLGEGKRWNDETAAEFAEKLSRLFGHQFSLEKVAY